MAANDKHNRNVNALEALAGGQGTPPAEPAREREEPHPGSTSGLMLLGEPPTDTQDAHDAEDHRDAQDDRQADVPDNPLLDGTDAAPLIAPPGGDDGENALAGLAAATGGRAAPADLAELAGGEVTSDEAVPTELAAAIGSQDVGDLGEIAAASSTVTSTFRPQQRSTRLSANARRIHGQAYKRTMIPVLMVVGLMLIGFAALTMAILISGDTNDPESLASAGTYMQRFGKYFILASLPMGAILLMGAWLFYVDVKRHDARSHR